MNRRPEVLPVIQEILLQYVTGHSGGLAQDLINASRMIALYKNARGESLRPIAIPTVWRKIVGRATVVHFREVLRHAAGDFQYAAMTPDGRARMVTANHHDRVFVRTDIQTPSTRLRATRSMKPCSMPARFLLPPSLLGCPVLRWQCWITLRPLTSFLLPRLASPKATPQVVLLLQLPLHNPFVSFRLRKPIAGAVAYADDVLLDSQEADIHRVVNTWHALIAALDLRLNPDKMAVWGPNLSALPPRLAEACPAATFSCDGLVICGIPVDIAGELAEDHAQPLGNSTFTESFLEQLRRKLRLRLEALTALTDALGPSSSAAHLAVHILRVFRQPLCMSSVHEWAGQLQADVHTWLAELLLCPLGGPASQLTLSTPLRFAGLGILNFQYEAALHFIQGALALNDNASFSLGNAETWSDEIGRAIGSLERVSGIDVETLAAPKPPRRQGRVTRTRFCDALAKQLHEMVPGMIPTGKDAASSSLRVSHLLAWYVASPDTPKLVFCPLVWHILCFGCFCKVMQK